MSSRERMKFRQKKKITHERENAKRNIRAMIQLLRNMTMYKI